MSPLEEMYRLTKDSHVKMMTRILGGDWGAAEDVVQEAYCRAIQFYPSYDPDRAPLKSWFNKILFQSLRDVQNLYKNRPVVDIEEVTPEDLLHNVDSSRLGAIMPMIDEVQNETHQQVLYLFFVLGYNSREISQMEEVTQTNVTTIVSRFKEKL